MPIPHLKEYSTQELYEQIALSLFTQYKTELSGFADPTVFITKEAPGGQPGPGWTTRLVEGGYIPLPESGGKYIELERCLSSIVAFYLILDGSEAAYQKFIRLQKSDECLTFESFSHLHKMMSGAVGTESKRSLFVALLIYSDLGKTPAARKRALEKGISAADHDDWIEAVLALENNLDINFILPSFFSLTTAQKIQLKAISSSLKIHLGHVLHLEGGVHMFDKLLTALGSGEIRRDDFTLAFLIQMCDVSASQSQVNNDGFAAMTEHTFQAYQMVWKCLEKLFDERSAENALNHYVALRAQGLTLDPTKDSVLIRLACMLRLYTVEEIQKLFAIAEEKLTEEDWSLLNAQYGSFSGMNTWARNPTYIPAVFVNLFKPKDSSESFELRLTRALKGAICVAKILADYARDPEKVQQKTPLCFNGFAGLAAIHPEYFDPMTFDDSINYDFDAHNNVTYTLRNCMPEQRPDGP